MCRASTGAERPDEHKYVMSSNGAPVAVANFEIAGSRTGFLNGTICDNDNGDLTTMKATYSQHFG